MDITQIQTIVLFRGMSTAETNDALNALSAREKSYRKGDVLLLAAIPLTRWVSFSKEA